MSGNRIIRHYRADGRYVDLSVDQTIASRRNSWKNWLCSAGTRHLYIDYDGVVWIGNCRIEKLGDIFNGFEIRKNWIQCRKELCGCGSDLLAPKVATEKDKSLLENLKTKTAAVGQEVPELELDESRAVETTFYSSYHVFWDLGRRCNYRCSYCWPQVHSSSEGFKDYALLKKTTDYLTENFAKGERIHFMFGGGEPTLHPHFLEWMQLLHSQWNTCVVTTNGSRLPDYYSHLIDVCNINLSVHFEFMNQERMIKNIEAILNRKEQNIFAKGLEVKIMVPPKGLPKAILFRDALKKFPQLNYSFVPIRSIEDSDQLVTYEKEEFDQFKLELGLSLDV